MPERFYQNWVVFEPSRWARSLQLIAAVGLDPTRLRLIGSWAFGKPESQGEIEKVVESSSVRVIVQVLKQVFFFYVFFLSAWHDSYLSLVALRRVPLISTGSVQQ